MLTALEATLKRIRDPEVTQLLDELRSLVRQVGLARTAAGLRQKLDQRDPDFKRYVD